MAQRHVKDITAGRRTSEQLTVLDTWLAFLRNKAKVVFMRVPDPADAFVIFETLNDRGLELSIADLTKNYIFGRSGSRVEEAKQNWNRMVGILEAVSDNDISKFYIHQLWSSLNGVTRDRELFGKMRERIHTEKAAIEFSSALAENARMYAALRNADHEYWNSFGPNAKRHIRILASQLRVSQVRTLLLAVVDKFGKNDIKKVLSHSVWWSVRFLIAGGSPGNLESYYAAHALKVRRGDIKTAEELSKSMAAHVPNDDQFRASFSSETVSTDYLARYYLRCLEKMRCKETHPHLSEDDETVGSLEHVLPRSPDKNVWNLDDDTIARLSHRIGNLALLAPADNSNRGNDSFKKAKVYYAKSPFRLTQDLATYGDDWGESQIDDRQRKMADLAVKVWPIG